jgi:peptide-methionine (S)-S-oxide reductase
METATFGAGCFWGVEAAFRRVQGVAATRVGYAGGTVEHPSYEQVCLTRTGHTEVVEVTYDPAVVAYDQVLETFWRIHDPRMKSKIQYKSVIFYHTPAQRETAVAAKARLQSSGEHAPLVTEILPAPTFYPAEEYHQRYNEKHGETGCSC